jgi:hypothetical protein
MVTNPSQSPTSGVIVYRKALQMVAETTGACRRQALWCATHSSSWPSGQDGCNDFMANVMKAEDTLTASIQRHGR